MPESGSNGSWFANGMVTGSSDEPDTQQMRRSSSIFVKGPGNGDPFAQIPQYIYAQTDAAAPRTRNIVLCLDGTGDRCVALRAKKCLAQTADRRA